MANQERRLKRQFAALSRRYPRTRSAVSALTSPDNRRIRLPVALGLIGGSFLSVLPLLGLWMLPLGVLLLAVDVPALRPVVTEAMIRGRRRLGRMRSGNASSGRKP